MNAIKDFMENMDLVDKFVYLTYSGTKSIPGMWYLFNLNEFGEMVILFEGKTYEELENNVFNAVGKS